MYFLRVFSTTSSGSVGPGGVLRRMIEADTYCVDVLKQAYAVERALKVLADRRRTEMTPEQRENLFGAKQYARH